MSVLSRRLSFLAFLDRVLLVSGLFSLIATGMVTAKLMSSSGLLPNVSSSSANLQILNEDEASSLSFTSRWWGES